MKITKLLSGMFRFFHLKIKNRFIAYKFPHGFSYAYISPESLEWRLSQSNLTNDGFLRNTFDQVFKSTDTSVVYGMYNDEVPDHPLKSNEQWFGHMKGLYFFLFVYLL